MSNVNISTIPVHTALPRTTTYQEVVVDSYTNLRERYISVYCCCNEWHYQQQQLYATTTWRWTMYSTHFCSVELSMVVVMVLVCSCWSDCHQPDLGQAPPQARALTTLIFARCCSLVLVSGLYSWIGLQYLLPFSLLLLAITVMTSMSKFLTICISCHDVIYFNLCCFSAYEWRLFAHLYFDKNVASLKCTCTVYNKSWFQSLISIVYMNTHEVFTFVIRTCDSETTHDMHNDTSWNWRPVLTIMHYMYKCILYIRTYAHTHLFTLAILSCPTYKRHSSIRVNTLYTLDNTLLASYSHTSSTAASTWYIDVLALLWLVAHYLNGQVGWVSLHLLSFLLLPPCWWPFPFWTRFDTVPSPCMEGGSSPASQEGLGQLRGVAQLTTSQLSSAPLQSLVHHCMHHCTDCAGGQWQRQHKWQEDWQRCHCHCSLWACAGHCVKKWTQHEHCFAWKWH